MAVDITVVKEINGVYCDVTVTGLDTTKFWDVYRLQIRFLGEDDAGAPVYEREYPDRKALWTAVAHRVHWKPATASVTFRDYESPVRPFQYFVVESSLVGPFEYTTWGTPYPVSRGVLDSEVIHLNRDAEKAISGDPPTYAKGDVIVRSTSELGLYAVACLVEMEGPKYMARGNEQPVMGRQYPVYVSDTRESRRGTITLLARDLGQYNDVRRIVFPSDGKILPIKLSAGGDPVILLDDMMCVPLDIEVEQTTQHNADYRYLHIDYVEVDPAMPLLVRIGDNDKLDTAPKANFTISDSTPAKNQWITLTNTSTGNFTNYDWTIGRGTGNAVSKYYGPGPYKVRWSSKGDKYVKLRVYGPSGASTKTVKIKVH